MKMKPWIFAPPIIALAALTVPAFAVELPELTQHLNQMLDSAEGAVNRCEADSTSASTTGGEQWYYRRFWLRFKPRVAFAIPGIAKLEISPELEMLWQRDLPADFEVYKP